MLISPLHSTAPPAATPIAFSSLGVLPKSLEEARKRGERILMPIRPDDFKTLQADTTGRPKLIGLRAPRLREVIQRFTDNRGVIGFEGLLPIFQKPKEVRRAMVGLCKQLSDNTHFSNLLVSPQIFNPNRLQLRVTADRSRTTTNVPHIVHPHVDKGPIDYGGSQQYIHPYAVGIGDMVLRGGRKGSVIRVLGSVEDYESDPTWAKHSIALNPGGYLRPVRHDEVEQKGYILLPHTGSLYIGSNVSSPLVNRWGHYTLPSVAYDSVRQKHPGKPAGSDLSYTEADQLEKALAAKQNWTMPYLLAQFTRPDPDRILLRSSNPDQIRTVIERGQLQ